MNLILNLLKTVPLFAELTEEEHEAVIARIQMQYFPAHHILFGEGSVGPAMYIIKSGTVHIFNERGEIATLGDGDFFGEMALLEDKPRMASAETLSDSEIFVLKKEELALLLQSSPEIAAKIDAAYQKRLQENAENPYV